MKTICYITNQTMGNYHEPLFQSLLESNRRATYNLIVFEGRVVNSFDPREEKSNQQFLFDFVQPPQVDGMIIGSGSLLCDAEKSDVIKMVNRFHGIPKISLNIDLDDCICISPDNRRGMYQLIDHLCKDHGLSKFAFLSGTKSSSDSMERYEGFKRGLENNGVSIESAIFYQGDFKSRSGNNVMQEIIEKDLDIEGVICANDEMALGAIDYISKYHPQLKGKYAITGFDNIPNAMLADPALTTITQPLEEMMDRSLEILLHEEDRKRPDREQIPAAVVTRSSCGCTKDSTEKLKFRNLANPLRGPMENIRTYNLDELFSQLNVFFHDYDLNYCCISFFESPVTFEKPEDFVLPEHSFLKYAFIQGEPVEVKQRLRYPTKEWIPPNAKIPEPYKVVIKPLFFNYEVFGYMIHDGTAGNEEQWELLRGVISNTIKGFQVIQEKTNLVKELEEALNQVKQLKGLLPICSCCKNIRDDQGYWNRMEEYISQNSEAQFTHSICPDCAEKLYGYKKKESNQTSQ